MGKDIALYEDMFDFIDSIQNLDELDELKSRFRDGFLRDSFWKFRKTYLTDPDEVIQKQAMVKCRYIMQLMGCSIPLKKRVNKFSSPFGMRNVVIANGTRIGKNCTIYPQVTIGPDLLQYDESKVPSIGSHCVINSGARILGDVTVGDYCIIGANCVVTKDIPNGSIVLVNDRSLNVITRTNMRMMELEDAEDENDIEYVSDMEDTDDMEDTNDCEAIDERENAVENE